MNGTQETPYFPVKEDYIFVNDVPEEDRIRGDLPPTKKEECEVHVRCACIQLLLKYVSAACRDYVRIMQLRSVRPNVIHF